eukprot:CAMPEP_0171101044 /NCGR_PEP_ID=MMETSP0766_2-20121228/53819_1 /TAXON_ID=439317 /ORGANISM="Gambierdiscus australes, Strain CAWD 149" /LENGTH=108 /DNA_ID=CAMNT_0011560997 /DNA_START=645 /DNA_END=969 /DNA_ORIENTATION=-
MSACGPHSGRRFQTATSVPLEVASLAQLGLGLGVLCSQAVRDAAMLRLEPTAYLVQTPWHPSRSTWRATQTALTSYRGSSWAVMPVAQSATALQAPRTSPSHVERQLP